VHIQTFDQLRANPSAIVVPDGGSVRALSTALDLAARRDSAGAWRPTPVLTWTNALERSVEAMLIDGHAPDCVEFVLSTDQELALWSRIIAADDELALTAPEQVAPLARAAWRTRQLWALPRSAPGPYAPADLRAYARWEAAYRKALSGLAAADAASLLTQVKPPDEVQVHGFLAPPPQLAHWLARMSRASGDPAGGNAARFAGHAFTDREQEFYAAFDWARTTCATWPAGRVVVALDDPARHRALISRVARDVFGADDACFLGVAEPLASDPLFQGLLLVLDYAAVLRWDALSALLRHPVLAGSVEEAAQRALFDAELRALERHELPLPYVLELLDANARCPRLAASLRALGLVRAAAPRRQRMLGWLEHFDACLKAAGWPGVEPGHPRAERARRAWSALCDRLYRLDAVLPADSRGAALARLRALLAQTPASAAGPEHNVFVVSPGEAAALDPTHLWLAGCDGDALLGAARASPLLDLEAQREAGVPGADPARDLWRARVMIETLAARGSEHHASFAAGDGEQRFTPSPLLPALSAAAIVPPALFVPRRWRQAPATFERFVDLEGPPVPAGSVLAGGVAVLAAQSACPFRAFARFRLGAAGVEEPRPGLSARAKGTAVHRCLAALWRDYGDSDGLHRQSAAALDSAIADSVRRVLRPPPAATALEHELYAVERERLTELLGQWFEFEQTRGAFAVIACEQAYIAEWGDVTLRVRIDRVDRLADGTVVMVDYKTGQCAKTAWDGPRMNEPQLPYYALTAPYPEVGAIAFARVATGRTQWLQRPAEPAASDWAESCRAWRADLDELHVALAAGRAEPAPKAGGATCRLCDQAPFCRLAEHAALADDRDDESVDVEGDMASADD